MNYQFRRLLKTQAEILKEVRAQTVLLREIRDKAYPEQQGGFSYWVEAPSKPSCMDRLKQWWRKA